MNRDDIIRMVREALNGVTTEERMSGDLTPMFERFAALVAAAERNRTWTQAHWTEYERSIAAAERETCAKVCEAGIDMWPNEYHPEWNDACEDRAAAIRARGNP